MYGSSGKGLGHFLSADSRNNSNSKNRSPKSGFADSRTLLNKSANQDGIDSPNDDAEFFMEENPLKSPLRSPSETISASTNLSKKQVLMPKVRDSTPTYSPQQKASELAKTEKQTRKEQASDVNFMYPEGGNDEAQVKDRTRNQRGGAETRTNENNRPRSPASISPRYASPNTASHAPSGLSAPPSRALLSPPDGAITNRLRRPPSREAPAPHVAVPLIPNSVTTAAAPAKVPSPSPRRVPAATTRSPTSPVRARVGANDKVDKEQTQTSPTSQAAALPRPPNYPTGRSQRDASVLTQY